MEDIPEPQSHSQSRERTHELEQTLQDKKTLAEIRKLETEVHQLSKSCWKQHQFYAAIAPACILIGGIIFSWSSGWFETQQKKIEIDRKLLAKDIENLSNEKIRYVDQITTYSNSVLGLQIERSNLVVTNLLLAQERQELLKQLTVQADVAVARLSIQKAEELLEKDKASAAIPFLARTVRLNPMNRVAAEKLLFALTYRNYALPAGPPLMHERTPRCVSFSPDGMLLATASRDTVRIWDGKTGHQLRELECAGSVSDVRFTPDGHGLLAVSDQFARFWDIESGNPKFDMLGNTNSTFAGVLSARFSADGKAIITTSYATSRIWDTETGRMLMELSKHGGPVRSGMFSPGGKLAITASDDKTAIIWNTQTGHPVGQPLEHDKGVRYAEFSPDGKRVVTASSDGTARIWDANTSQPLGSPLHHGMSVYVAQFSPDGTRIVTASSDCTARVWNGHTGSIIGQALKHDEPVFLAQFNFDGSEIVTVSHDKTVSIWDSYTGKRLVEPFRHQEPVQSAQFSPDGRRVVTASSDHTAQIWDVSPGCLLPFVRFEARTLKLSPDGRYIGMGFSNGIARISDTRTGDAKVEVKDADSIKSIHFNRDGSQFVTGCSKSARVWDSQTGRAITDVLPHDHSVYTAEFSPDGHQVATACRRTVHNELYAGSVRVWDVRTSQPSTPVLLHDRPIEIIRFSPDGSRLLTCGLDAGGRVWDVNTGQQVFRFLKSKDSVAMSAEFTPDGLKIVTGGPFDDTAYLWDAMSGRLLSESFKHGNGVSCVKVSSDGKRLLTASYDHTARLWDLETGQALSDPMQHAGLVWSARFSPDEQRIVTASEDRSARIWDTRSGVPLTEPLYHDKPLVSASFSRTGDTTLTITYDPSVDDGNRVGRFWQIPPVPLPVPSWFLEFAEAVVGQSLNSQGAIDILGAQQFLDVQRKIRQSSTEDFYYRWAKWFVADRLTRSRSPFVTPD